MWRFLRNLRLILRLHYYLGTHILGASRGGPCDSTALVFIVMLMLLVSPSVCLTSMKPGRVSWITSLIRPNSKDSNISLQSLLIGDFVQREHP